MSVKDLAKESITIQQVGPYGVKANDVWYKPNEPLVPSDFVAGNKYSVLIKQASGGKKYIHQIVSGDTAPAVAPTAAPLVAPTFPITTSSGSAPVRLADNKDRRILWQGISQAALVSPALAGLPFTNIQELVANAKEVAKQMVSFVDEQSK